MKITGYILTLALLPAMALSQISGKVTALENGEEKPLPGANVYWEGTESGTVTNKEGEYKIERVEGSNTLVVRFIGYKTQSKIMISRKGVLNFRLVPEGVELEGAEVTGRVDATSVDLRSPELTYKIDDKELRKAACCNLSESFETNASVDVAFTDAVTGTRQIEMLGLAGKYALIQMENIPFARGLNATTGLTYIPGPFVESIQVTKGLSSVLNGYESITGQINVEFYKPETSPLLFLNAFGNMGGRMELNAITAFDVKDRLSTAVMAHASTVPFAQDKNDDGFADIPTGKQLNFSNRWHFHNDQTGWEGQMGVNAITDDKKGGQMDYIENVHSEGSAWGYESRGNRLEIFGKNGRMFKDDSYNSLGLIYSLNYQDRYASFGSAANYLREYNGKQANAYFNSIFQDEIGSPKHKYKTGISVLAEQFDESLDLTSPDTLAFLEYGSTFSLYKRERTEIVPGAYFEYVFEPGNYFTMVAGLRADYNSYFKQVYVTPRLNLRYMPTENTTLRLGGGRGQRTANIIAENLNVLASSRNLEVIRGTGLDPEVAWNSGASIYQVIPAGDKPLKISVDAFYTWFENKLIADLSDPLVASLYQASGSRSFSLLGQVDYELFKRFEMRVAYKYLDSREAFTSGTALSYLIPPHRAFTNLAYSTENNWKFDFTLNWFGTKRLPESSTSPAGFQRDAYSPDFLTANAQINKAFKNGLEVYLGADNLFNFRQENPIVNAANPYDPYFDTNYTWGPVFGRNIYVGLYYSLDHK